ncbi:hypothetical protein [Rubripirellula reticaptiva]|uniref:Uncharacterized protein n=1 Tax=Rubripirellula reticaptiva TaxID=2528013 RepID=A0A5C6FE09_9BACT|nr:hypothetical protein [Rubripirellula reticaptiva]TWU57801.1 hypothetical protein Poly59_07100 [Rubripirellula reticaptiva]
MSQRSVLSQPLSAATDRRHVCPWIVVERALPTDDRVRPGRWFTASRQFVPAMVDPPLMMSIVTISPFEADNIRAHLAGYRRGVVVWDVDRDNLVAVCDRINALAIAMPAVAQIAAAPDLSDGHCLVLSEFRVAATIRHPEDLPGMTRFVGRYFAV